MRGKRTDKNLKEIYNAARALGMLVNIRNDDLADLDVQYKERLELWEVKDKGGTFTPRQEKKRAEGWRIRTVRNVDDVIEARKELAKADDLTNAKA